VLCLKKDRLVFSSPKNDENLRELSSGNKQNKLRILIKREGFPEGNPEKKGEIKG